MKTAVIITGEMRTFDVCFPTLCYHVLRHFPGADFFVATIADKNALKVNAIKQRFPDAQVHVASVLEQPDCIAELRQAGANLPAEWTRGRFYTFEPYAISVHPQAVARQLWQLREGWNLFLEKSSGAYDFVIRVRPDLYWHAFSKPWQTDTETAFAAADVFSPWWGRFGGLNDRFAILNPGAAGAYFTTYSNITRLMTEGAPFHPESLVAAAVAPFRQDILAADFSTLRENGEMRAPEIIPSDYSNLFLGTRRL